MKKLRYSVKVSTVTMPQTHNVREWKSFFEHLRTVDYFAPLYAVYYSTALICDKKVARIPSTYDALYSDVGIELRSDDRYPAYEAAMEVGFIAEGISMLISAASIKGEYQESFLTIVDTIFKGYNGLDFLADETIELAQRLIGTVPVECNDEKDGSSEIEVDEHSWCEVFLEAILTDPGAPASIVGYYLGAETGRSCSTFCPLGCRKYESLGRKMAQNREVFNAAKSVGILADGIETYIGAALDNDCNWNDHYPGIKFILDNTSLRCFVPARDLYLTERMIQIGADKAIDEDAWCQYIDCIKREFKDECRGY